LEKAAESSNKEFTKKRTVNAEVKQYKEQQHEAERYEKIKIRKDKMVKIQHLWKLYHLEKELSSVRNDMENYRLGSTEFTSRHELLESELKACKKSYAAANKLVLVSEKKLKTKERERLDLVRHQYLKINLCYYFYR
jgi:structural maintenance of chromosome 1